MAPRRVKKVKAKAPSQTFYFPFMAAPIPISLTEEDINTDLLIMQGLLMAQQEAVKRASVEREVAAQAEQQAAAAAAAAVHAASYAAAHPAAPVPMAPPAGMGYQQNAAAYVAAVQAAQAGAQQAQQAKAPGVASPCATQQLQQLPQMLRAAYALA